jgi:hypothetical protein
VAGAFAPAAGQSGKIEIRPYLQIMVNEVIGLVVGLASALAVLWMWRAAERLRKEVARADEARTDGGSPRQHEPGDRQGG